MKPKRKEPAKNALHPADGLPHIDPLSYYDTEAAAILLNESPDLLRTWRSNKIGPVYQQKVVGGKVRYFGAWLIAFRAASIKEPRR